MLRQIMMEDSGSKVFTATAEEWEAVDQKFKTYTWMNAVGFVNGSDGRFFEEGIQGIVSMCNCCSEVGVGALMYLLRVAAGLEVKNQDVHPERDATSFSKVEIARRHNKQRRYHLRNQRSNCN